MIVPYLYARISAPYPSFPVHYTTTIPTSSSSGSRFVVVGIGRGRKRMGADWSMTRVAVPPPPLFSPSWVYFSEALCCCWKQPQRRNVCLVVVQLYGVFLSAQAVVVVGKRMSACLYLRACVCVCVCIQVEKKRGHVSLSVWECMRHT